MENIPAYEKSSSTSIRQEYLVPFAEWTIPTADEIRQAMKLAALTGSGLAALVGVKNSRTVRRWTGGDIEIPRAIGLK